MPTNDEVTPATSGELRLTRMRLGFTQQRMAEQLGVSTRTIEEYESGRSAIPLSVTLALQVISMNVALARNDPNATTMETGLLAERIARLRAAEFRGDRINGWAISIGTHALEGEGDVVYSWAVAADSVEEALAIMNSSQPKPKDGFSVVSRLSQFTIAKLGLKKGEACPL
jgi:transcriptional regulator with XRE-family HTH domain